MRSRGVGIGGRSGYPGLSSEVDVKGNDEVKTLGQDSELMAVALAAGFTLKNPLINPSQLPIPLQ